MPRHQKSKHHAHRKHHRARSTTQAHEDTRKISEATGECPDISLSLPDADSCGISKVLQIPPLSTDTVDVSCSETYDCSSDDSDGESFPDIPFSDTSLYEELLGQMAMGVLQLLIHNYSIKQLSTKEDMVKIISKEYESHFPEVLSRASEKLEDVFAVEVREVNSCCPTYNLISKLKLPNNGRVRAGKGLPKTGFLMRILSIILVKGNCVSEEEIWTILKKKQVYPGKKHFIYGEPRKLLTQDFVRLKYLEYRQVANSDPPRYEFLWGPQAHDKATKTKIMQFLAKVNQIKPTLLTGLYEEEMRELQESIGAAHTGIPAKAEIVSTTTHPASAIVNT